MAALFAIDLLAPSSIRLHILYVFPLAAIALHSQCTSLILCGLLTTTVLQLFALYFHALSAESYAADALVAFASSVLTILLAKAVQDNHMTTMNLAATDWLTGLHNRRSFETIADMEIKRQKRYGGAFSLAVIDLDGFKALNDSRGHDIGDKALQLVADVLREHTRQSDTVARLGGDEFAVLMPNTRQPDSSAQCQQLAATISTRMADAGFAVTASIGCVQFEQAPASTSEALQDADKAMYAAKAGGKNGAARRQSCA
jgi:diguanylate cyclase (GGDEF)-like protein